MCACVQQHAQRSKPDEPGLTAHSAKRRALLLLPLIAAATTIAERPASAGILDGTAQALIQRAAASKIDKEEDGAESSGEDVENPYGREIVRTSSGLQYTDLRVGKGEVPKTGDVIVAHVKGMLPDGMVFDDTRTSGAPLVLTAGVRPRGVTEGLEEGILSMRAGSVRLMAMPPSLGFGPRGGFGTLAIIPAGSPIRYEVELLRCVDGKLGLSCCSEPDYPCRTPTPVDPEAINESPLSQYPIPEELAGLE